MQSRTAKKEFSTNFGIERGVTTLAEKKIKYFALGLDTVGLL
jgi:hypothetical protein